MAQGSVSPMIVGVGRSGTTLLRLMLDAHPELAIPPETHFIPRLAPFAALPDARPAFVGAVTTSERWSDFGLSGQEVADVLQDGPLHVSECLRRFFRLYAAKFGKPRWGDKTPAYLKHMRPVHELLPEAGFIHIIRDGRDVALSTRSVWFGQGRSVSDLARAWVEAVANAREQAAHLPHYLEVQYEALVDDPTPVLQHVCAFIGLDFHDDMLAYPRTAADRLGALQHLYDARGGVAVRAEHRRAIHMKTLSPPDPTRASRWRAEMSDAEQAEYEAVAGGLLRELGYETRAK